MKRAFVIVAVAFGALFSPSAFAEDAFAEDESPAPEARPDPKKVTVAIEPTAGWLAGKWMGVPVTRVAGGIDLMLMPTPKTPVGVDGTFFVASGTTENGLDVRRIELGAGITSRPSVLRFMAGAHLSYAWMNRMTMPGRIGGFGIGAHACVEGAIRLAETIALTIGLRGSADAYDGGFGYEGGPFGGLRF